MPDVIEEDFRSNWELTIGCRLNCAHAGHATISIRADTAEDISRADVNRRDALAMGLTSFASAALTPAFAQATFPERPIRLVVPFAPSGATDIIGRMWADKMKPVLGTVFVDNQGGAGGVMGTLEVARAQPDGHTLLFGSTSTLVINPAVMSRATYDPIKDFIAIAIVAVSSTSIVVHASVPVRSVKELIAYAKANPGRLSYGSAGAGTVTNFAGELFKQMTGLADIVHIPYKGAGPGVADLVSGHIPLMMPNVTGQLLDFHQAGKIRILAVNAPARLSALADVPTATEEGLSGLVAQLFLGVFAPAGTPAAIVDQIHQATRRVMADEDLQKVLIRSGYEVIVDSGPEQAQRYLRDEIARLTPIIKASGFRIN